jgi:hypothetical protein
VCLLIRFIFNTSHSFLTANGHPITIPSGQVPHAKLSLAGLDRGPFVVILPRGERFEAEMRSGTAGYGPYYQLRFKGGTTRQFPEYITLDQQVLVMLLTTRSTHFAVLEYLSAAEPWT